MPLPPLPDWQDNNPAKDLSAARMTQVMDSIRYLDTSLTSVQESIAAAVGLPGSLLVDTCIGATDSLKFADAAARSLAAPIALNIQFSHHNYTLTTPFRPASLDGIRVFGTVHGVKNPEISSHLTPKIFLAGSIGTATNAFIRHTADVHDMDWVDLCFQGTQTQQFIESAGGSVYPGSFDSLTFYGLVSGYGRSGAKFLATQMVWPGHHTIDGFTDCAFNIGGSDLNLFPDYLNLGGPPGGNDKFMCKVDTTGKTIVGPHYTTANNGWLGWDISGRSQVIFASGSRWEGRNTNTPCTGTLLRVRDNAVVRVRDPWIGYAMSAPTPSGSKGYFEVLNTGNLLVDAPSCDKAVGVSDEVPYVYADPGATMNVTEAAFVAESGLTFSGRPRVKLGAGTHTGRFIRDGSVQLTTDSANPVNTF